jgi:hypothetical protein
MRLFHRSREEEIDATPARHHLAMIIEPILRGHPDVTVTNLVQSKEGPLGGINDCYQLMVRHEGRETFCRIAIYGDSPEEVRRRFDG